MARQYRAGELSPADFKRIRQGLLLTQKQLAETLGYAQKIRISEYERLTNPVPIPLHIQEALLAMHEAGGVWRHSAVVRAWTHRAQASAE